MTTTWNKNAPIQDTDDNSDNDWELVNKSKSEKVKKSITNTFNINYQEIISQVFKNWPSGYTMTYITLKASWIEDNYQLGNYFVLTAGLHQKNLDDKLHFSVLTYTSDKNAFYLHFNGHLFNGLFWVRAVSAQTNRGKEGTYTECIALYPEGGEICANGTRK